MTRLLYHEKVTNDVAPTQHPRFVFVKGNDCNLSHPLVLLQGFGDGSVSLGPLPPSLLGLEVLLPCLQSCNNVLISQMSTRNPVIWQRRMSIQIWQSDGDEMGRLD